MATTREDVIKIQVPESTRTYVAIPNQALIDSVDHIIESVGLQKANEKFALARGGNQVLGRFNLLHPDDNELGVSIMFGNSYDKTMPVSIAAGGNVMICSNGMVRGDVSYKLKHHYTNLNNMNEMVDFIKQYIDTDFKLLVKAKSQMKSIERPNKKVSAELVGRMLLEEEILGSHQLAVIRKELDLNYSKDSLSHNQLTHLQREGHFIGDTLWDFYNNITQGLKVSHPTKYIKNHIDLHSFIEEEYSL